MSSARLDARFLLPDPDPDRVGYVGRRPADVPEIMRRLGCVAEPLAASARESRDAPPLYPLILAWEPSDSELALAARHLAPGGALIVETSGPLRSLAGLERRLAGLGFASTRSYWHWPSFDRCTRIIPLRDRTAVRYALSRVGGGLLDRLRAVLARVLLRVGGLERVVTHRTVVAHRGSEGAPFIQAFLDKERWKRLRPEGRPSSWPFSFVILTPRFQSSRRLVHLLLPRERSEPLFVAKVPRHRGPCAATEREGDHLARIHACRAGGFDSIPRLVTSASFHGRTILVETAMPGRAMDRATVRAQTGRCCDATLAWLIDVQLASRGRSGLGGSEVIPRIESDLQEIQRSFPEVRTLIERTRDLVRPLSGMSIPYVLEHGDLSHPNLLLGPDGKVSVIDWESAELGGLPAVDLIFFLAYVARAVDRAGSTEEVVRALDRAFQTREGWARTYLRRYADALELHDGSMAPLFIACWVRQAAGALRRAADGESAGASRIVGALRQDWRVAVWRHAVEHADRVDWSGVE